MQKIITARARSIRINTRWFFRRLSVAIGLALYGLFAGNAFADAVNDLCADPVEVCKCAASQLRAKVGEQDYALYESTGSTYLINKNSGMNMVEAWDAAVKAESGQQGKSFVDTLNRTNKIGSAHREAITACKS